jgi:hypothetical protein
MAAAWVHQIDSPLRGNARIPCKPNAKSTTPITWRARHWPAVRRHPLNGSHDPAIFS